VLRIFIALKNPSPWPGFEPATFGSSGTCSAEFEPRSENLFVHVLCAVMQWKRLRDGLSIQSNTNCLNIRSPILSLSQIKVTLPNLLK
jgi:hypothetical protein